MVIKLGELLLKEHLITPEQLDEGLVNQALFGIKLGSALIELGFVSDEQLCNLLSSKLGVPAVPSQALKRISPEVLALVPTGLAAKHRVIPISVDGRKLALAMADPTDFKAIDEVAFVTSYVIIPYILPEVLLDTALAKHYEIRRDPRYLRIEGDLAYQKRAAALAARDKRPGTGVLNASLPSGIGEAAPPAGTGDGHAPSVAVERHTIDKLSLEFASAQNRDQIADTFITYLGQEFSVGALFIIRNNMAVGWRGIAAGKRLVELEKMTIPLSKLSVLSTVSETGKYCIGTLLEGQEDRALLAALGLESGAPLLVLPIVMVKKVVAEVVVLAEPDAVTSRLHELQKLVYKASLAFEMLIIKNKILVT